MEIFITILALAPALALFLLRIVVAIMFVSSGWLHLMDPAGRGKSIDLSPGATAFLGAVELIGGAFLALGFLTAIAAFALIIVMVGAIWFKAVRWKTGFFGENNSGWYYELLLLSASGILFTIGPGIISLDVLLLSMAL